MANRQVVIPKRTRSEKRGHVALDLATHAALTRLAVASGQTRGEIVKILVAQAVVVNKKEG